VRRFFALAYQHMRWQLNDLARRLDGRPAAAALADTGVAAPPASSASGLSPDGRRMLGAISGLPEDEREVLDLVGIQGLTHAEAAAVVGGFREDGAAAPEPGQAPAGGAAGRPASS
jgi:RNA polymerase sigma-70 factor (ECF subfamily)